MRPLLYALAALPLLAACDNNSAPPAPAASTPATQPAAPAATRTAAPANFPFNVRPLLGTWGADAAQCAENAVVITATAYSVGRQTGTLQLTDNRDGSFALSWISQQLTLTPIFGPPGEGIRIQQGEARPTNVFRCR